MLPVTTGILARFSRFDYRHFSNGTSGTFYSTILLQCVCARARLCVCMCMLEYQAEICSSIYSICIRPLFVCLSLLVFHNIGKLPHHQWGHPLTFLRNQPIFPLFARKMSCDSIYFIFFPIRLLIFLFTLTQLYGDCWKH